MTPEELVKIESKYNVAIIAPAGHGKTEMVADMVAGFSGKQLVLTHTNAGVDAIQKRLSKRKVDTHKYTILTIAAFCNRWGYSYHWTSRMDATLSPFKKVDQKQYYAQLYTGALELFKHTWVGKVLSSSYKGIIVDEYQDCTLAQHALIKQLNKYLPVRVLGDPLQGIFGFKDPIVNWSDISFELIDVDTYPWRWENSNPKLGAYLEELRSHLLPAIQGRQCMISIAPISNILEVIAPLDFDGYKLLRQLQQYKSVLYLAKWENDQLAFCKKMPGIFQQDEKQDCGILFEYARLFDQSENEQLALSILCFINECATRVSSECNSYIKRLKSGSSDFSRIKKYEQLGRLLKLVIENNSSQNLIEVFHWFEENKQFKFYRMELYQEMLRSIRLAATKAIDIYDAATLVRNDSTLQKRYTNFKYLSSRTLLSKGLEFDCVIVDMTKELTAKEFYVAMTRAKKMVYLITDKSTLILKP